MKKIASILFILMGCAVTAYSADPTSRGNVTIKWKVVSGAYGYQIQIRDSGQLLILDQKAVKNEVELSIPPGHYQIRIGSINKFGRVEVWSTWRTITIAPKKTSSPGSDNPVPVGTSYSIGMGYMVFQSSPYKEYIDLTPSLQLSASFIMREPPLRNLGARVRLEMEGMHQPDGTNGSVLVTETSVIYALYSNEKLSLLGNAGAGFAFSRTQATGAFGIERLKWERVPLFSTGLSLRLALRDTIYLEPEFQYRLIRIDGKYEPAVMGAMHMGTQINWAGSSDTRTDRVEPRVIKKFADTTSRRLALRGFLTTGVITTELRNYVDSFMKGVGMQGIWYMYSPPGFLKKYPGLLGFGLSGNFLKSGDKGLVDSYSLYSGGIFLESQLPIRTEKELPAKIYFITQIEAGMTFSRIYYYRQIIGSMDTLWSEDFMMQGFAGFSIPVIKNTQLLILIRHSLIFNENNRVGITGPAVSIEYKF